MDHSPRHLPARILDTLGRFVFPARCLACETSLPFPTPPLCLCAPCRGKLSPPPPRCPLCGSSLPERTGAWLCVACGRRPRGFDRLTGMWTYEPPAAQIVRGLKYQRLPFLADDIATEIAPIVAGLRGDATVVTHVPLHWRRRARRGYDQAGLLAAALAAGLGVRHTPLLRRQVATPAQTSLGRAARLRNLDGAFVARRTIHRYAGGTVLLVDDVATTGATLEAASVELKRRGIDTVSAIVVAITPKSREC